MKQFEPTTKVELLCQTHFKPLEYIDLKSPLLPVLKRFLCAQCREVNPTLDLTKSDFKGSANKYYVVSLANKPDLASADIPQGKTALNFSDAELEHVLVDNDPNASYPLRNLVYIPSKKLLAACSANGKVKLWSVKNSIELMSELDLKEKINCANHVEVKEKNRHYLMIASNQYLLFYVIKPYQGLVHVSKVNCTCYINDIIIMHNQNKFITIGNDEAIRVWDLYTFSLKLIIHKKSLVSPLCSAIYLEDENLLAVEGKTRLSVVKVDDKEESRPRVVELLWRRGFGLGYLPKSKEFLLRKKGTEVLVINKETLNSDFHFSPLKQNEDFAGGFKFLPNEDESQILSNSNESSFLIYQDESTRRFSLQGFVEKSGGIQVMYDQRRFVVGDSSSGVILVFRVGVKEYKGPLQESTSKAEEKPEVLVVGVNKTEIAGEKIGMEKVQESSEVSEVENKKTMKVAKAKKIFKKDHPSSSLFEKRKDEKEAKIKSEKRKLKQPKKDSKKQDEPKKVKVNEKLKIKTKLGRPKRKSLENKETTMVISPYNDENEIKDDEKVVGPIKVWLDENKSVTLLRVKRCKREIEEERKIERGRGRMKLVKKKIEKSEDESRERSREKSKSVYRTVRTETIKEVIEELNVSVAEQKRKKPMKGKNRD